MKTGQKIKIGVGIVLLILLIVGVISLLMKASAVSSLKLGGVKMTVDKSKANLTTVLGGTLPFIIELEVVNYSAVSFLLNQTSIEIFQPGKDGQKIGGQTLPLTQPIKIEPNVGTPIKINFQISIAVLAKTFKDVSVNQWIDYYYTGKPVGKKVVAKGFVIAEAIKINIDNEVEI